MKCINRRTIQPVKKKSIGKSHSLSQNATNFRPHRQLIPPLSTTLIKDWRVVARHRLAWPEPIVKKEKHSVVLLAVQNAQNRKKQVENVQVKADCSRNLFFDVVLPHDELRVHQDVRAENQCGEATVDQLSGGAIGKEHGHEAEQEQGPKGAEEIGHPGSEVVLGLAGEGREEDEDAGGENDGVENDGGLVEGYDDGDAVCLEQGEAGEEQKVRRVGLALPKGEEHESDGAEELSSGADLLASRTLCVSHGQKGNIILGTDNVPRPRRLPGVTGSRSCTLR